MSSTILLSILIGVVSFFLKKTYSRFEKMADKLDEISNKISGIHVREAVRDEKIKTLEERLDKLKIA